VVGADGDNTGTNRAGSVYVYDLSSDTPTLPWFTLTNPSPAEYDSFGAAVAIDGTSVIVGSPGDDTSALNAGSAYVYDLASLAPTIPLLTLINPTPAANDDFGDSVAISGTRVVIGAPSDDTGATGAGSAYVYDLTSATPTLPVFTLNNPSPGENDGFGWSVAMSGTRLVVGATGDEIGVDYAGSAYVYDLASATPTVPVATLANPSPAYDDGFGSSVAIEGVTVVVGTPYEDTNAQDRGAAYLFGPIPQLRITPTAPGLATLSWTPATSSGFALQYADALAPTNWLNAPSGATNPVTLSLTNGTRFYRLRGP